MRYSKMEIKGLPTPEEIVVSSMSEFTDLLSQGNYEDYLFRGEPSNYDSIVSSALRGFNSAAGSIEYPFIQMKEEFKRELFHKLTLDERTSFLAFAQHHGLPTNLVDFTRSPLIALFFACQPFVREKDENADNSMGFIYLLHNKMINISEIVTKYEDENLLELLAKDKKNMFWEFYKLFHNYNQAFPLEFHHKFQMLIDDWNFYYNELETISDLPEYSEGDFNKNLVLNLFDQCEYQRIEIELTNFVDDIQDSVLDYVTLLRRFLKNIIDNTDPVYYLNGIPNFIYDPILPFERGRNQHGLFIYEAYISFIEKISNSHILARQRIWPDKVIVIKNKTQILKSLDLLGINEKFIYGDYDSIARYIKRKYQG